MRRLALVLGAMIVSTSAFAAGVDSRLYTCAALHSLVTAHRFVFINNPDFQDFVVVDASYCSGGGGGYVQRRSVPTTDTGECPVNYCTTHNFEGRMGGGGM